MALTRQVTNLECMLIKQQSTFGTLIDDLDYTNYAEVMEGASVTFEPVVTSRRYVGVSSGNSAPVIGPLFGSVKFSVPIRSGGQEVQGFLGTILPAFGMAYSEESVGGTAAKDKWTWTISEVKSNWKDLTVWTYSGNKGTSMSVRRKLYNVLLGGKIVLNFEEGTGIFEVEGKGAFTGNANEIADATQPTQQTASGLLHPAMRGATITILGSSNYTPLNFEVDFNQDVINTVSPAGTHGVGFSDIVRKGLRWRARVYQDTVANIAPENTLVTGGNGSLSIVWGAVPHKFTLSSTKIMLEKVDRSEQNGVGVYDLEGIMVDNAMSFVIETQAA